MSLNYLGALDPYIGDIGARRRAPMRRGGGYARAPARSAAQNRTAAAYARSNRVASYVQPDVPGSPARDAALIPGGFPPFAFVAGTGTAIVTQQMNVMCPFRGQRLTVLVLRSGASALVTAPMAVVFQVGMRPVLASGTAVPIEVFGQQAFDTNVLLPPTTPGVPYTLGLALTTALAGTDTLTCIVGVVGSAVV
jgi:hypothetical protein